MQNSRNSKANGCGVKIFTYVISIVLLAAFFGSLYVMPLVQRIVLETVCKPGTIVYDKWTNRRKTPTCIDKKTGKKIDGAIYEIFGCCPGAFIMLLLLIFLIVMTLFRRASSTPDNNSPPNFRNHRA